MSKRRAFLLSIAVLVVPSAHNTFAQSTTPIEMEVRDALSRYQQTWNTHDVSAWSALLTDDIWFTQAWDSYERQRGRDNAVNLFKSNFMDSDLSIKILKIKIMPDGTATVSLSNTISYLPKTEGKYRMVFEKSPSISRWRKVGAEWKMFFFTSDKGWALDQLKKDGIE